MTIRDLRTPRMWAAAAATQSPGWGEEWGYSVVTIIAAALVPVFLSFPGYLTSFLNYSSFLEFHLNCSYLFLLKTSKPGDYPILSLLSESIFSQSPAPHWLFPARSVRFSSAPNPINIFYLVPLELLILIELILGTTHLVKDFILIFYITKILTLFYSTLYQLRKI